MSARASPRDCSQAGTFAAASRFASTSASWQWVSANCSARAARRTCVSCAARRAASMVSRAALAEQFAETHCQFRFHLKTQRQRVIQARLGLQDRLIARGELQFELRTPSRELLALLAHAA